MTDSPDNSAAPEPPRALQTIPAALLAKDSLLPRIGLGALILLTVLLAAQWWSSRAEIRKLRTEVAQRLQSGAAADSELKTTVKSLQDGMKDAQAKLTVMESRQVEAQSQQLALEQLYQELNRNRDDWALAEIDQVLSTASQQLQLAGNVQGALIALQTADSRLARADKPQFIMVRRAIARDMERLRALPSIDLAGLALRVDSAIGQVDRMPMLADEKTAPPATQPKNSGGSRRSAAPEGANPAPPQPAPSLAGLGEKWRSWTNEMWMEVRQLVQVRIVESPEALLLSPSQAYFARENLKLRLLNARLALLSRNEVALRGDLIAAQDVISRYFDTRAKQTQAVQAILRQVQASDLSIEMPTLAESLEAVRNHYKRRP